MSEFTAAIGCVQVDRQDDILTGKMKLQRIILITKYQKRVIFPEGMVSGYYKYIVFDQIEKSTGKVYGSNLATKL
jgi:1-acyl-sn-glycerol-3-phosphate acyltransferase